MGGPGSGKSTTAAGVFYNIKKKFIDAELVCEFAKDLVWNEAEAFLNNQIYIFGEQHNRIFRLKNKVDVIITDSPFIMGIVYADFNVVSPSFEKLLIDEFNRPEVINLNYFIDRVWPYTSVGRLQNDENEAIEKDNDILNMLNTHQIPFKRLKGKESTVPLIVDDIISLIEKNKNEYDTKGKNS